MDVKPEHQTQWQTYLDFIEDCSFLTHSPDTNLASHHIIPLHLGGTDDADNLIDLTYADHYQAHRLLYETFGLAGDHRSWKRWEVAAQDEQKFLDGCSKGGKATVNSRKAVDSGQLASLHAKWISLYDGHICPRNWISRRNKEDPNRFGTWVEL